MHTSRAAVRSLGMSSKRTKVLKISVGKKRRKLTLPVDVDTFEDEVRQRIRADPESVVFGAAAAGNSENDVFDSSEVECSLNEVSFHDESDSEDETPKCPICTEWTYPTVVCPNCSATFCEKCVLSWVDTSGREGGYACGLCRATGGEWKPNRAINDMLGVKRVPCHNSGNGCAEMVSLNAMKEHLSAACAYAVERCSQSEYGCKWRNFRKDRATHEATCQHQEWAETREIWNRKIEETRDAYEQLQVQCAALDAHISEAALRLDAHKERTLEAIDKVQRLVVKGRSTLYQLKACSATHVMEVPRSVAPGHPPVPMLFQLRITADADHYSISICAESPKLKYPFFLLGYMVCLNQRVSDERAVAQFHRRFSRSKEEIHIAKLPRSITLVAPNQHGFLELQFLCTVY